jgi:hypothetical protein
MNITIDDFAPLGTLVKGYELDPAKHYVFIFDGKHFDRAAANSLFEKVRGEHPEMCIHIIGTQAPKAIEVLETTLANQIEAKISALDSDGSWEGIEQWDSGIKPLLNRAIKALRGDHGAV